MSYNYVYTYSSKRVCSTDDRMNNISMPILPKLVQNQNQILLDKSKIIFHSISESFYICVTSSPCQVGRFLPQQPWHLSIWPIDRGCNSTHTVEQLLQELDMDAPFGPEEKQIELFRHGCQRVAIHQDFRFIGSALKALQCQGSVENLAWILTSHAILGTKMANPKFAGPFIRARALPTYLKLRGASCQVRTIRIGYHIWVLIKIKVPGKGTIADQPRINRDPKGDNRGGVLFVPMSFAQNIK